MKNTNPLPPDQETLERLERLVQQAQAGDESVLLELRQALDERPDVWQHYGDLAAQAQAAWLHLITGEALFYREALERKLNELRVELAGPAPTPLERLLVDRVVACWLQLHHADASAAQLPNGVSLALHTAAQRRQNSAQHRYLHAIKTLATVRKLLRPPISPMDLALRPLAESRPAAAVGRPTNRVHSVLSN